MTVQVPDEAVSWTLATLKAYIDTINTASRQHVETMISATRDQNLAAVAQVEAQLEASRREAAAAAVAAQQAIVKVEVATEKRFEIVQALRTELTETMRVHDISHNREHQQTEIAVSKTESQIIDWRTVTTDRLTDIDKRLQGMIANGEFDSRMRGLEEKITREASVLRALIDGKDGIGDRLRSVEDFRLGTEVKIASVDAASEARAGAMNTRIVIAGFAATFISLLIAIAGMLLSRGGP